MDMKELIEQDPLLGRWFLGIKITIRDHPSALNGHHVNQYEVITGPFLAGGR